MSLCTKQKNRPQNGIGTFISEVLVAEEVREEMKTLAQQRAALESTKHGKRDRTWCGVKNNLALGRRGEA